MNADIAVSVVSYFVVSFVLRDILFMEYSFYHDYWLPLAN
jgi:hypothetical protein